MTFTASACAKVILLGEHAAVYGIPALAVPVSQVRATASLTPGETALRIIAPAVQLETTVGELSPQDPLAATARLVSAHYQRDLPGGTLVLQSEIPMAAGMGSGAAVATAVVRVLARAFGREASPQEVSALVFEVERIHHGTPSGIDNTVIAFEKPIYFVRERPPSLLSVGRPFQLVIADSGQKSPTRDAVAGVRARMRLSPAKYNAILGSIAALVETGRRAIAAGAEEDLGQAMTACHGELQAMGVSNPRLDRLVAEALSAGALGAKLSGAGLGGIVIALVRPAQQEQVAAAWRSLQVAWLRSTQVTEQPSSWPPSATGVPAPGAGQRE